MLIIKHKPGFTVPQLLIAISILIIFAVLLVPNFLGRVRQAQTVRLFHDAALVEDAAEQYHLASQNERWPIAGEPLAQLDIDGDIIQRPGKPPLLPDFWERVNLATFNPAHPDAIPLYALNPEAIAEHARLRHSTTNFVFRPDTGDVYVVGGITRPVVPPPPTMPIAMITITPATNILTTTNIIFGDSLSTGSIVAREWQLNSGTITATPPNGILPAGHHTIRLRVQDSNGLWSDWALRTFEVQALPVAILTMNPSTGLTTATNIAFTHNTTSGGQTITAAEWQRNSDAITTTPPNGTFTIGNHIVRLRVQNAGGIWSDWAQTNFSVGNAPFVSVGGGHVFSFGRKANGLLWLWGNNGSGQLGDGTIIRRYSPVQVLSLANIIQASAGATHSLALQNDGTVWASGLNGNGQLGDNTQIDKRNFVQVSGLTDVVSIAGGQTHSLALRGDGTVWAWGYNGSGQLGDGTTTQRLTPVQVSGLTGVIAISAGWNHSLALRNDGTVWAWGRNTSGELGDGTTTQRLTPVQVSGLTGVIAISAGWNHSLALRNDGTVWAWGNNSHHQLGDGTTTTRLSPVRVGTFTGATAIATGALHGFALRNDGTVMAWGHNGHWQLGDGTATSRGTPIQIPNLTDVAFVGAGGLHSFAIRNDGNLWAWGNNWHGQLGNGTISSTPTPILIPTP